MEEDKEEEESIPVVSILAFPFPLSFKTHLVNFHTFSAVGNTPPPTPKS